MPLYLGFVGFLRNTFVISVQDLDLCARLVCKICRSYCAIWLLCKICLTMAYILWALCDLYIYNMCGLNMLDLFGLCARFVWLMGVEFGDTNPAASLKWDHTTRALGLMLQLIQIITCPQGQPRHPCSRFILIKLNTFVLTLFGSDQSSHRPGLDCMIQVCFGGMKMAIILWLCFGHSKVVFLPVRI